MLQLGWMQALLMPYDHTIKILIQLEVASPFASDTPYLLNIWNSLTKSRIQAENWHLPSNNQLLKFYKPRTLRKQCN